MGIRSGFLHCVDQDVGTTDAQAGLDGLVLGRPRCRPLTSVGLLGSDLAQEILAPLAVVSRTGHSMRQGRQALGMNSSTAILALHSHQCSMLGKPPSTLFRAAGQHDLYR